MSANFFRPAHVSPDPEYPRTDPGCEYILGITETWFGPLARRLGVEGQRATLEHRRNLYARKSPDGGEVLLPVIDSEGHRPAHGGNFFISKSLNGWIASQPEGMRKQAERHVAEAAKYAVESYLLPEFYVRRKKGGVEHHPAEAMAVIDKHVAGSMGHYLLHILVTVPNIGRAPDGRNQVIDNAPHYDRQGHVSVAFVADVMGRFHREFGLVLSPKLEVKGMEALRGAKTPRAEEIERRIAEKGLPPTSKVRDIVAQETHRPRDPGVTVRELAARTVAWLREKGAEASRAFVAACRATSELYEGAKAKAAVKRAVRQFNRLGRPQSHSDLCTLALREVTRQGARQPGSVAEVERVERIMKGLKVRPERFGLERLEDGKLTSRRIEKARARTERLCAKLSRKRGIPPTDTAFHKLALGQDAPHAHREPPARAIDRRGVRLTQPDPASGVFLRACEADGRRVFLVAGERTAEEARRAYGQRPESAEALARRLGPTPLLDTFLEVRRHRWRSARHAKQLYDQARAPQLVLGRKDVVVIDARDSNRRAVLRIAKKARAARATLILIDDTPQRDRARERGRLPER